MSDDHTGMERRTFLAAGAGSIGMAALLSRMSGFVSAQAADPEWETMTAAGGGEYTYTYDAPAPTNPDGLLGTVDFRVLQDGSEVLTTSVELGIDPDGREFRFEDDATDARLRGVVVSQDGQVSASMRGDNLTDGAIYRLLVEAPGVAGTPSFDLAFEADGEEGSGVVGPVDAPADFPNDESELRLTVTGTLDGVSTGEFDADNVSDVNPVEDDEPPEGDVGEPVTQNGVTLQVLEPLLEGGAIEFVGGGEQLFRVSVSPDTNLTVQLRITLEPPEAIPEPVADGWHELAFGEDGRFTGQWYAPGTANPDGLLGGFFFRIRDRNAPETVLSTFAAELGIDAPGREFGFDGVGGTARLRGGFVVLDGLFGLAIRGDNLTPGGDYSVTVSEPGGASRTVDLEMDGDRGSAVVGPEPTALPEDETLLRIEVNGPEFTEGNVEEPGPIAPADPADPAPTIVPVDPESGDYVYTVFDPEIEVLDPGFEVEVVGDDVYPIELEVSRNGETALLTDEDVIVEWQAIADGETLAPPEEGQEPSPEPGVWYPMEDAQSGTKLLGWQAPPVVDPEGVEGLLQIRASDADGPVAEFSSEVGVVPAGIEFGIDDPSGARMDGTFTVEATADSRIIGGSLRGRFLTPGEQYTVTFADGDGDGGTPVTVTGTADAAGELTATFGPLDATGLPLEETDVSLTVAGSGFGDDVEVETEVIPGIDSDTPIPVRSADGDYVLWILEPDTAGPTFPFETVVFGGTLVPFRAKVTDGSLPDDATLGEILDADPASLPVEWNLIVDGLPQEPVSIAADDPPVDPEPGEPPATPGLGFTDIVFAGLGAPAGTSFSFTVSGQVTTLADAAGGTVSPDGTTASGQVTDGELGFRFTGAITSLTIENDDAVEVRMRADGETAFTVVDPDALADPDAPEPPVPTPPDDAPEPAPENPGPSINTVVISSEDIPGGATYQLVVDGVITPVSGSAVSISPDGTTATGTVGSFKHAFNYVGSIVSLSTTGYVEVFINGQQVSSDQFDVPGLPDDGPTEPPRVERKLVIDSSGIHGHSAYEFTVEGGTITAVHVDDDDAVHDDGTRATGRVSTGKDVYRYTGTIRTFRLRNPSAARLYVDGVHVPYEDIADHEDGPDVPSPRAKHYQVDLVVGRPNKVLGETYDDFYGPEGRLIAYLHGTSERGETRRALSGHLRSEYDDAIETTDIEVSRDGRTAYATVRVREGETLTLSLVSYLKPGAGFSRSVRQTMYDAETVTLSGGSYRFVVDLPRSMGGS